MKDILKEFLIWFTNKNWEYKQRKTNNEIVEDFLKEKQFKMKN